MVRAAAVVGLAAALALLAGCTPAPAPQAASVAVAVSEPLTSLNPATTRGRGSGTNADVAFLTGTGFGYADDAYRTVRDGSFGSAEIVARDPFTVRYTVSADARWSDGAPITAADLLLAWAAGSGALDTPGLDPAAPVPPGAVWFDGRSGAGLETATSVPRPSSDGRSLTVAYDAVQPQWRTLLAPGLPAHVVVRTALGLPASTSARSVEQRLVTAVRTGDTASLARIATTWRTAYDTTTTPSDAALLVASGPYRVRSIAPQAVTLEANPRYRGARTPAIRELVLKVIPDGREQARQLARGAVDVVSPPASADVVSALADVAGVGVTSGTEGVFEHLALRVQGSRSGAFDDPRVRQAFLDVVPRQQIVEQLVGAAQQGATALDSFTLRPGADGYDAAIAANGSKAYRSTHPDDAAALLAAAGATAPEVCILYDPTDARRAQEFQLIQASATRAGFRVTDCSRPDADAVLGTSGAYDAALLSWDTTRLGRTALAAGYATGGLLARATGVSDPATDALVDRIVTSVDTATQTRLLTELDTREWDAAAGAPLFAEPTVTAVDGRVSGVTRSPLAVSVLWDAWAWKPAEGSPR